MQMIHPVFNTAIQGNDDVPEDMMKGDLCIYSLPPFVEGDRTSKNLA